MRAYIVNNRSGDGPRPGHFGCTLVMETYREQLERVGIEEVKTPEEADLVIVNGEGSLHHGHRRDLLAWPTKYPSVFVNAVYQANEWAPEMGEFLYRAVRESLSAEFMCGQGWECDVVPDVVLTNQSLNAVKYDPVAADGGIGLTDNVVDGASGTSACESPATYLDWLSQREGVVCGRFHAAIACAVIGVPFSTWDSNTWKIRGLMKDIGILQFHGGSQLAARAIIIGRLPPGVAEYVDRGKQKINRMFESFLDLV